MSEFKGTPAPWAGKDIIICSQDRAGLQLGFLNTHSEARRVEGLANAYLIAAAPDLLISLQQIISSANRLGLVSDDDSGLSLEVSKAEFYINKALGK